MIEVALLYLVIIPVASRPVDLLPINYHKMTISIGRISSKKVGDNLAQASKLKL
jgi:hypothetical protein